jgi:hypothetical protein
MTTPSQVDRSNATGAWRRQIRVIQLIFAGTAALAMLALFDAARPDSTQTGLRSGSVRLTDLARPAPAGGPRGPQYPQMPPNLVGSGGFAADDGDDEAQLQQQLAQQQQMQQAQQQAEEQNEQAQQQAQQAEQQGQWVEDHPGP